MKNLKQKSKLSQRLKLVASTILGALGLSVSVIAQNAPTAADDICTTPISGNLVCNSGFEHWNASVSCQNVTSSFYGRADLSIATRWYTENNSPDIFMRCDTTQPIVSFTGSQFPRKGNVIASITTYHHQLPYWVEYIQQNLPNKLIAGRKYYTSFYAVLAKNSNFYAKNLGVAVVPLDFTPSINITPKIVLPTHLSDKNVWKNVGGTFVANGTEQKLLIGRFGEAQQIATSGSGYYCNYNIDDVSLILLPQNLPTNLAINCGLPTLLGVSEYTNIPSNMNIVWKANGTIIVGADSLSLLVTPTNTITSYKRIVFIDGLPIDSSVCIVTPSAIANILPNVDNLPNATLGNNYSQTISQEGLNNNVTYFVSGGVLPSGLTIDPSTGIISGVPQQKGTFFFSITATNGICSGNKNYTIVVGCQSIATPTIYSNPTSICLGTSATVSIDNPQPNTTYLWSNGQTGTSVSIKTTTTLTAKAIANGCTSSVSNPVTISLKSTDVNAGLDTSICSGSTVNLPISSTTPNTWFTLNPLTLPDQLSGNAITLFNDSDVPKKVICIAKAEANGCTSYDTTIITVYKIAVDANGNFICGSLEIPNVITTNDDGKNDVFKIEGLELFSTNKLSIYNRWGKKVYEQENYTNTWNGDSVNGGIYFYSLELFFAGNMKKYKGWIDVLK